VVCRPLTAANSLSVDNERRDGMDDHRIYDLRKAAKRMAEAARTRTRDCDPAFESWEILELLDSCDTLNGLADQIERGSEDGGQ